MCHFEDNLLTGIETQEISLTSNQGEFRLLRENKYKNLKSTMNDLSSDYPSPKGADSELQDFLLAEKQKAQFHAQIHEFNDFCWDKCVDKPGAKLDSRTETCITNCVERFIDVSLLITNRFAQMLEKGGGMH